MCKEIGDRFIELLWGSSGYRYIQKAANGRSGGLVLIWDTNMFQANQAIEGDFFLAVKDKLKGQNSKIIVLNVYGPHKDNKKRELLDSLENLLQFDNEDWILCGDFNEVRHADERKNYRSFVSNSLIQKWNDLSVLVLDRKFSDHCPLSLRSKVYDYGPKPVKVFDSRLNHTAETIISSSWNTEHALKLWSKQQFGTLDSEIEEAEKKACSWEIANEKDITDTERVQWLEARRVWLEKDKVKTNMLKQKSRAKWIVEGEENTKYFHSMIKRRINKNTIRGLHINGKWEEDPSLIKKEVHKFYEKLFQESDLQMPCIPSNLVGSALSADEFSRLECKFELDEVWEAG
ncbi:uncharacterized protein [Rutidosis leptorrhynchoides]|uniref:uncharacterized protein n=1 Tax=Rutidosis leptorrhynchoides TaxID=125765 RepID=UPI003A9982D2